MSPQFAIPIMEAHNASKLAEPWQPAGVDIEPDAPDANVGLCKRKSDIKVCAGSPHLAIASHNVAYRNSPRPPAQELYGNHPRMQKVFAVEDRTMRNRESLRPDLERWICQHFRGQGKCRLLLVEAAENRIAVRDTRANGKPLHDLNYQSNLCEGGTRIESASDPKAAKNIEQK